MNVKELIEQLKLVDQKLTVMVHGDEVTGVEVVIGKITQGYYGKEFEANPKSRKNILTFTHLHEISTGEVVPTRYWL